LEKNFFLAEINTFPFFHIHESGKVKNTVGFQKHEHLQTLAFKIFIKCSSDLRII